jgi:hypothetical protein
MIIVPLKIILLQNIKIINGCKVKRFFQYLPNFRKNIYKVNHFISFVNKNENIFRFLVFRAFRTVTALSPALPTTTQRFGAAAASNESFNSKQIKTPHAAVCH